MEENADGKLAIARVELRPRSRERGSKTQRRDSKNAPLRSRELFHCKLGQDRRDGDETVARAGNAPPIIRAWRRYTTVPGGALPDGERRCRPCSRARRYGRGREPIGRLMLHGDRGREPSITMWSWRGDWSFGSVSRGAPRPWLTQYYGRGLCEALAGLFLCRRRHVSGVFA